MNFLMLKCFGTILTTIFWSKTFRFSRGLQDKVLIIKIFRLWFLFMFISNMIQYIFATHKTLATTGTQHCYSFIWIQGLFGFINTIITVLILGSIFWFGFDIWPKNWWCFVCLIWGLVQKLSLAYPNCLSLNTFLQVNASVLRLPLLILTLPSHFQHV